MKYTYFMFLALIASACSQIVRYDNFTLYRVVPKTNDQVKTLVDLEESNINQYDFWTHPKGVGVPVDILVSPKRQGKLFEIISDMDHEVVMKNLQDNIDKETRVNEATIKGSKLGMGWDAYYRLDDIYTWLRSLSADYPNIVTLIQVGDSYEGRPILGVKLSFKPGNEDRSVWLDSLIHAREWIAGATSTFILNELLTSSDPSVRSIAESHDWYIVPVLNPDGYEFTHTNNRLWRKTRQPYSALCIGADPNRNWGYRWNTGGASNIACSETYAGPRAFSEIETDSVARYLSTISRDLLAYISFHSYSQMFLLPYGHTTQHLDNYNVVRDIALKGAQSLAARYGTRYVVGNVAETIYVATGSSGDYAKGTFQTPIAITYELRDTGVNGFVLPPSQIIPTGLETLDSIVTILREADRLIPTSNRTVV